MDLSFSPEEEAFREEVRTWLAENVPAEPLASMDTSHGFEEHRAWGYVFFDTVHLDGAIPWCAASESSVQNAHTRLYASRHGCSSC